MFEDLFVVVELIVIYVYMVFIVDWIIEIDKFLIENFCYGGIIVEFGDVCYVLKFEDFVGFYGVVVVCWIMF